MKAFRYALIQRNVKKAYESMYVATKTSFSKRAQTARRAIFH